MDTKVNRFFTQQPQKRKNQMVKYWNADNCQIDLN